MTLPAHWHAPTQHCHGYRRSPIIDQCADCGGPSIEHAGWCADEVHQFKMHALMADQQLNESGFQCGCDVPSGTRVDFHNPSCPHRILIMASDILAPSMSHSAPGSRYNEP